MRLSLHLTKNVGPVPFNHLESLIEALSRWLDHDLPTLNGVGLYSFGWLHGARQKRGNLLFENGATWRISFFREADAYRALEGTKKSPSVAFGMQVKQATLHPPPDFEAPHRFLTDLGPIINRRPLQAGKHEYLLCRDREADAFMTETFRRKLDRIGLPGADLVTWVAFDRSYRRVHSKLITVYGEEHRGSICPVVMSAAPEALTLAWTTGIGDLTEYGFGALR